MADNGAPHVTRATFFRNGDPNFKGKMMVVNPRYYRNFESFLDTVTSSTRSTNAVTRICTPHGRNFVHSVENFQNGGNYVVLGRERFKRLNYGEERNKNTVTRLPPILRNQMPSSGRYRKVYEGEKQALKRIYVYRNGDSRTPPRMILLKKRNLADMELVLSALQESRINFDFAISKLFTLKGKQIHSCDEILHDGRYVATQRGSRFKPINYEGISNFSPRSVVNITRFTKLPPIASRINPSKISNSPRKPAPSLPNNLGPSNQTKRTDKKQVEKREKKRTQPMPAQDSIISPFEDQDLTRESFSHVSLSVTPPPLDESPDFTLSENIGKENEPSAETVNKSASPELAVPSNLDNLPDDQQEDIGLQLYNASGMQSEWGDMVVDSKSAVTDKPIDDVPAEEVNDEEVTENDEGSREKTKTPEPDLDIEDETAENEENGRSQSVEEVINIEQPSKQENTEENQKEDEIAATASRLVERILQEEENEQTTAINDEIEEQQSKHEEPDNTEKEEIAQSPQPSMASSQEDLNSEDEVQSSQEDEQTDDDDDDEKDDDENDNDEEKNDDKDSKNNTTQPQSEKEESEAEEPATKENRTNKKVEQERSDPSAVKKNPVKQDHAKGRRREKRVDNKA
ncbi:doublecortin domain-containing protein 2 [Exaiptasia diaphana]|uniref:Doublecortin domain-containing protein n=1 Tax=Exaiptasia diaphana TaxID=2652724 RepID=A0A913XDQ3_EXADI|nr:doublecortin domain-containing protein 2 [Exaiptasia diaphana]XP_020903091.1 doublecortin domain-containing protein 2 [Exaiptasia diaphana]XP_020903092.1 doublecortin domain-containing protein 2 [Exaiptasia diaphana]KXJ12792.1 Doublecortin domain-containing protein 2 [Exaiptasia diaphana]